MSEDQKDLLIKPLITTLQYKNSDIEIHIPVSDMIFSSKPLYCESLPIDTTPNGSLASPFFPDSFHSNAPSPQISPVNINTLVFIDSPISVKNIPHVADPFMNFGKPLETSQKNSSHHKQMEVFCEICCKNIKKRSYKAHLKTKIHQTNLHITK
ncbi:hypothetical protein SteCoe_17677 [Stentor coeruleus]|uniref:U1-type domain-containing protein n=1 Tax=Stentor coeruleus TaxID=5963 RepID=A0A1R2BY98_9CILI|nr:hypothetical protein SteCoe_17677 [Stentor coeruleus]